MLPPGAIFELKIHQNAFAAGASPTGRAYSAPPDPIAGFQAAASRHGRKGEAREGKEGERSVPSLVFYYLTTG